MVLKLSHDLKTLRGYTDTKCLIRNFPDWQLDSSLGRYDGKVYEDMFERASELNPLNALTIDPYPTSEVLIKKDEREKFRSKL